MTQIPNGAGLADKAVYAKRSPVRSSTLTGGFLQRLWAEEGLFAWFDHQGNPATPAPLGAHTPVLADHNAAAHAQAHIPLHAKRHDPKEDSRTQWQQPAPRGPHGTAHRQLGLPHGRQPTRQRRPTRPTISPWHWPIDQPGAYAL